MLPATQIKSGRFLNVTLWLALVMTAFFAVSGDAYAQYTIPSPPDDPIGTNASNTVCGNSGSAYTYGFTRRIVQCVRDTVISSTDAILDAIFSNFSGVLGGAFTLAVAVWGYMAATGRNQWVMRQGFVLAVKIAIISTLFTGGLTFGFPYFYHAMLTTVDELLLAATAYVDASASYTGTCDMPPGDAGTAMMVWNNIDCLLDILIGDVIPNSSVLLGIGGFLMASLLTDAIGVFIALFGFAVIVTLLFAILRALYVFVLSYLAISVMAMVAPIFLPLMLFKNTRGYFEKWLKLTIGFILQPVFLFVYLSMLLAAFDSVVYTGSNSLYNVITGDQFTNGCSTGTGSGSGSGGASCPLIGEWLLGDASNPSAYTTKRHSGSAVNFDAAKAAPCTSASTSCIGQDYSLQSKETGVSKDVGEVATPQAEWDQVTSGVKDSIYEALGIDQYFFQINMPVTSVDWDVLAVKANASSTSDFLIDLLLSIIMAAITAYIFKLLLDILPFIGSGMTNNGMFAGSVGEFGFGRLAPPGANFVEGIKKKVMG